MISKQKAKNNKGGHDDYSDLIWRATNSPNYKSKILKKLPKLVIFISSHPWKKNINCAAVAHSSNKRNKKWTNNWPDVAKIHDVRVSRAASKVHRSKITWNAAALWCTSSAERVQLNLIAETNKVNLYIADDMKFENF